MKNYSKILILFLCCTTLIIKSSGKSNQNKQKIDTVFADDFTPIGSRQSSFNNQGMSDEDRTLTDSSQTSADIDLPSESGLFISKSRLLKQIQLYLKYEVGLSDTAVKTEMRSLRKQSLLQLRETYEANHTFMQREEVLRAYRRMLVQYKNYSSHNAQAELQIVQQSKVDSIIRSYYDGIATLTKNQMLEMIHDQIQFKLGFSGADADKEIEILQGKSLTEIRDTCMQYQRELICKDDSKETELSLSDRKMQIQHGYEQHRANRSIISSIPIVKNIASLLPTKVANWSDKDLYDQLALKMREMGFSSFDINEEIDRLKNSSVVQLQKEYGNIHTQLSKRLYYFDTLKHQHSDAVKNLDFWMQQLHQWGTTAAMVAAAGAGATGYNPEMLSAIASFGLFDPNLTFSNTISKRDMLDMIYQQYAGFDAIKHSYINIDHQQPSLESKDQLLAKINDSMVALRIAQPDRHEQMKTYQNMSKEELETISRDLASYATSEHHNSLITSNLEKKAIVLTRSQLLEEIKQGLHQLKIPADRINVEMMKLNDLNTTLLRSVYLDTYQALGKSDAQGKMPIFFSKSEQLVLNAPKVLATLARSSVQSQNRSDKQSLLRQHLREKGLELQIDQKPDGLAERSLEHAMHAAQVLSMTSSGRRFAPSEFVR